MNEGCNIDAFATSISRGVGHVRQVVRKPKACVREERRKSASVV